MLYCTQLHYTIKLGFIWKWTSCTCYLKIYHCEISVYTSDQIIELKHIRKLNLLGRHHFGRHPRLQIWLLLGDCRQAHIHAISWLWHHSNGERCGGLSKKPPPKWKIHYMPLYFISYETEFNLSYIPTQSKLENSFNFILVKSLQTCVCPRLTAM